MQLMATGQTWTLGSDDTASVHEAHVLPTELLWHPLPGDFNKMLGQFPAVGKTWSFDDLNKGFCAWINQALMVSSERHEDILFVILWIEDLFKPKLETN